VRAEFELPSAAFVSMMLLMSASTPAIAEGAHRDVAYVSLDGDVQFDGLTFRDPSALKRHLVDYKRRHHDFCMVPIVAPPEIAFSKVGPVVLAFQEAGCAKVGFLTEPRNAN
jgi:hypothetical protein